ncbi:Rv3654c family TadE-like protein [Ornithinimicrobium sufpigmenti]|uniref:Rv3654c family TadE-like protein n=1 Tax=Ornithinimicrobium sufpigmenti TaxID=2508882 RepID=UPI001036DDB8|nr:MULTISPECIES: Rv3654c family TadE-like protein [unclassified Ornithinimicrobium]
MRAVSDQRDHRSSDRGSASVMAVGVVAGLAAVLVAALALAAVLVAGQQARTAADLSALAAAGQVLTGAGRDRACAEADAVAARNGGRLERCELRLAPGQPWPTVLVAVRRDVARTPWSLTARAVAGATSPAA